MVSQYWLVAVAAVMVFGPAGFAVYAWWKHWAAPALLCLGFAFLALGVVINCLGLKGLVDDISQAGFSDSTFVVQWDATSPWSSFSESFYLAFYLVGFALILAGIIVMVVDFAREHIQHFKDKAALAPHERKLAIDVVGVDRRSRP